MYVKILLQHVDVLGRRGGENAAQGAQPQLPRCATTGGARCFAVFVEEDTFHLVSVLGPEVSGQQPQQGAIGALHSDGFAGRITRLPQVVCGRRDRSAARACAAARSRREVSARAASRPAAVRR